jgi:hypothetical protein
MVIVCVKFQENLRKTKDLHARVLRLNATDMEGIVRDKYN